MAATTTLREHPPIGSFQVWYSRKHPTTPHHPHQRQQSRQRSSCALGTLDFSPKAFGNVDHRTHSRCRTWSRRSFKYVTTTDV